MTKFHIYRASNSSQREAHFQLDDAEEIAEFKAHPPHERATLEKGIGTFEWECVYWSIEIESLEDLLSLCPSVVIRPMDYNIKGLRTLIIYDGYIE